MNWLNWRNAGLAAVLAVGIALPAMAAVYEKQGVLVPPDTHIKLGDSSALRFGDSTGGYSDPSTYDVTMRWDGTDFDVLPNANNTILKWGNGTVNFDQWWYGSSTSAYFSFDASANDLKFEDSVSVMFGTGSAAGPGAAGDVELRWDGTDFDILAAANNQVWNFGNGTNSWDVKLFGSSTSLYATWDASANDLIFEDSASVMFGGQSDVEFRWDGTDFDVLVATDDYVINFGNGTNSPDIKLFGNTTAAYALWDASADDLILMDSTSLKFGTGSDAELRWDATDLDLLATADDSVFKIGNGTNSWNLWLYGNTASDYILWTAATGVLSTEGSAYIQLNDFRRKVTAINVASYSVAVAESGTIFTNGGASGSIVFTLPTVAAGLAYEFWIEADEMVAVTGAAADLLVIANDAAADQVWFDASGSQIGNHIKATGNAAGDKWLIQLDLATSSVTYLTAS